MKIVISGASGFIGKALISLFRDQGVEIIPCLRTDFTEAGDLVSKLKDADVVIHLAGAPIAKRWTKRYKQVIYDSRILTTRRMSEAILQQERPPRLFISVSGTGIYPEGGPYTEEDEVYSEGFLGTICRDWEHEARKAEQKTRVVIFRLGVVLSAAGGALEKLLPIYRVGLGGPVGNGRQGFPWVHLKDLTRAVSFAIGNDAVQGVYNLVAPQLITNREFSASLGRCLTRPALIPVPVLFLTLLLGEGAKVLTEGQKVLPRRLTEAGFSFDFENIDQALRNILGK